MIFIEFYKGKLEYWGKKYAYLNNKVNLYQGLKLKVCKEKIINISEDRKILNILFFS